MHPEAQGLEQLYRDDGQSVPLRQYEIIRPNKTAQLQRAIAEQGHPHRVTWDNVAGDWATAQTGAVYLGHCYKDAAMVVAIGAIEK